MANATVTAAGTNQTSKAAALADATTKTSAQGTLVAPTTTNSQLLG
jgi:dihydrodipicolinate synthase/N-acetylneuraminate lyase